MSKTREIISRTVSMRNAGVSRDAATLTLRAQHKTISLQDAAAYLLQTPLARIDPVLAPNIVASIVYGYRAMDETGTMAKAA